MTDNEDIKAKMREALDRKKPHDSVEHDEHNKKKAPQTHGPVSSEQMFRRKSG
jgi:hypothetical protein